MVDRYVFTQVDSCAFSARIGRSDSLVKGLVTSAADLGDKFAFLDTVGAVRVLNRNEAISHIAIGNILVKRTAGDLEVVSGGIA